jgi:small subunit ribosomal protein S3Ae
MAEKVQPKPTARKVKDKWKSKNWYSVVAPDMFNRMKLGETLSETPEKLMGRIIEVTVQDLTGDFAKTHIKLKFRINRVAGTEAYTEFVGHILTSDYIRRMTRRKRSKTDVTVDIVTKDDFHIRVKPMAIAERRIQSSQQTAIRNQMMKTLLDWGPKITIDDYVRAVISGDLLRDLAKSCKPIQPMQRVEVRRSDILKMGIVPEIKPGPGEPAPAEGAQPAPAAVPAPGASPEPAAAPVPPEKPSQ